MHCFLQRHALLLLRLGPVALQVQDSFQRLVGEVVPMQIHVQRRVHQVLRRYQQVGCHVVYALGRHVGAVHAFQGAAAE